MSQSVYRERFGKYSPASLLLRGTSRLLRFSGRLLQQTANTLDVPRIVPSADGRELLERNRAFLGRHSGQRCFVIGTGPSLKRLDLGPLGNDITFGMNTFWQHPVVEQWQPTYFCLGDPVFQQQTDEMDQFFDNLTSRVPRSTFFVPLLGYEPYSQRLSQGRTFYYDMFRTWPRLDDLDLTRQIPVFGTVAQLCLMLAIYMGCSPIYLLGLDHDWLAQPGILSHFHNGYGGMAASPDRRSQPEAPESYRFKMQCLLFLWGLYEALSDIARRRGIEIINLTDGGCLDVFPRGDYESIICRQRQAVGVPA